MVVNSCLKDKRFMANNQLPEELHRVTLNVMNSLESADLSMSVMALVNSVAFLIQQTPKESHEDLLNQTIDMLMNFMGFIEVDPEELANATKH